MTTPQSVDRAGLVERLRRKKVKVKESAALKDARARFSEMEGHAQRWAKEGAPLHVMADAIAALDSIAGEISRLTGEKK